MQLPRYLAIGAILWALSLAQPACAQGVPRMPFQPTQPTISKWMGLYQHNTGPLDNYHMIVRPEGDLQATLRQQNMTLQQQGAGLDGLTGQVEHIENRDQLHPTGTGSVFMDYSHFYDSRGLNGGRVRSPARRLPNPATVHP
jgi:hypothetical protein